MSTLMHFADQTRVPLAGSERTAIPAVSTIAAAVSTMASPGQPLPATPFTVSVIVRRKSPIEKEQLGTADGRLTRVEFARRHGPADDAIALVMAFAKEYGLKAARAGDGRRTINLTGTPEAMERAFGVTLSQQAIGGQSYRVREGAIYLPESLCGHVDAVLGLDNRPQARAHARQRPQPKAKLGFAARDEEGGSNSFTPTQMAQLYGFPAGATADGQTIGIIQLAGGYRVEDLTAYFGDLGLPVPEVTAISVGGATNSPSTAESEDREVMMDIEVCAAVAPGAKIVVYFAPNTDQGFADAISTAVHDTVNRPSVISISWGGPESAWTPQSVTALDGACQSAAALGVTITVAAGDLGSSDGPLANGPDEVDFPASSPHVLACGGTTLTAAGDAIAGEVVWNGLESGFGATGGGVSAVFPRPSWQNGVEIPEPKTPAGGRGVPDVSAHGDTAFGYAVRVDGENLVVGGTSAVAPLWAGLIALANKQNGGNAGFINPALYAKAGTEVFRDVTVGNNGSFQAKQGWDACSGLGSPVATAIIAAIAAVTAAGN